MKNLSVHAIIGATLAISLYSAASRACGYHDDVSITRGALNWTYPEALHVIGAISAATMAKQLAPDESSAPDPFGAQYRVTVKALERFALLFNANSHEAPPLSFSLVLIEPMLWTHFEAGPNGLSAQAHMSGPRADDLVGVSGQEVIRAIANGRLSVGKAHALGLFRIFGTERQTAQFSAMVANVGEQRSQQRESVQARGNGSSLEVTQ